MITTLSVPKRENLGNPYQDLTTFQSSTSGQSIPSHGIKFNKNKNIAAMMPKQSYFVRKGLGKTILGKDAPQKSPSESPRGKTGGTLQTLEVS